MMKKEHKKKKAKKVERTPSSAIESVKTGRTKYEDEPEIIGVIADKAAEGEEEYKEEEEGE